MFRIVSKAVRAFSHAEEALTHLLDRTGVPLSTAKWLLRLYRRGELVEDRANVARRLEVLVQRMEKWERTLHLASPGR